MAEGYVKIKRDDINRIKKDIKEHEVKGIPEFAEWKDLNNFYNQVCIMYENDFSTAEDKLKKLKLVLEQLLRIVKSCQSALEAPACYVGLTQLVNDAKMFDNNQAFVNAAKTIMDDVDALRESLRTLYTKCNSRIRECEALLTDISVLRKIINDSKIAVKAVYDKQYSRYQDYCNEYDAKYGSKSSGSSSSPTGESQSTRIAPWFPFNHFVGGNSEEPPAKMGWENPWWDANCTRSV